MKLFFRPDLFPTLLPVARVDGLSSKLQLVEGSCFGRLTEDILEMIRETFVVVMTESKVAPVDASEKVVELHVVLENPLVFSHTKVVKIFFSIASRVYGPKVSRQLLSKVNPAGHPRFVGRRIEDDRFKPLERSVAEERKSEVDFDGVIGKRLGVIAEVELTLEQEGTEFPMVGTIKSIRFLDFLDFGSGWL